MTNPITTLTCPSCGGKLQISDKINRFACGYCGNEQIVHRESGIVYLEPIAEDVRHIRKGVENIQGGVDKTAAELAIVRLTKELNELEIKLKNTMARDSGTWQSMGTLEGVVLIGAIVMFIAAANTRHPFVWLIFLLLFGWFMYLLIKRSSSAKELKRLAIDEIQADISDVKVAIGKNRRLINS